MRQPRWRHRAVWRAQESEGLTTFPLRPGQSAVGGRRCGPLDRGFGVGEPRELDVSRETPSDAIPAGAMSKTPRTKSPIQSASDAGPWPGLDQTAGTRLPSRRRSGVSCRTAQRSTATRGGRMLRRLVTIWARRLTRRGLSETWRCRRGARPSPLHPADLSSTGGSAARGPAAHPRRPGSMKRWRWRLQGRGALPIPLASRIMFWKAHTIGCIKRHVVLEPFSVPHPSKRSPARAPDCCGRGRGVPTRGRACGIDTRQRVRSSANLNGPS